MNSSKTTKFINEKSFDSPSLAWICDDNQNVKSDQSKPSRFAKFKIKTKKSSKKNVEIINGELIVETPRLLNAFCLDLPKSTEEILNHNPTNENHQKKIRKSSTCNNIRQLNEDLDEIITVYPVDISTNKRGKNKENNDPPVIITIVSSDESSNDNETQIKSSKQSKSKMKQKNPKSNIEISEVYYFKNEQKKEEKKSAPPFPWIPKTYRPDFNEDEIIDETLSLYQIINILIHPVYNEKSVLIDLRDYNQYQLNTILGAKHFSEYQDKTGEFSIRKVKLDNYTIAILISSCKQDEIKLENDEKLKIFKLECTNELEDQLHSLINQSSMKKCKNWISFTCFDSGNLLISENFEKSLSLLTEINIDALITNRSQIIYKKLSENHSNKNSQIISITSNDILSGDYSDKMITNNKLMSMLDQLQTYIDENNRILILIEDHDQISLTILILILMYKNHWSLHDSIACVKYVRSLGINLKQNYMNILKNFEKLFFGRRLYSGGNKPKLHQEFALEL